MSATPPLRRRTAQRRTAAPIRLLLLSTLLLDALFLVSAVAAWPIYRSGAFLIAVGVALILAHGIVWAGWRWRLNGWWLALLTFGIYVIAGVPVAAPELAAGGPAEAMRGLLGVVTAPVTGWKDLLTLELPLGSYQATLAPVFLLWLAIPVAALSLAWRSARLWVLSPVLGLLLTAFGVLFGAPTVSDPVRWGFLTLTGPVEMAVGAAAILLSLAFVVWRALADRRRALRAAEAATGIRATSRSGSALAGRITISAAMVVCALAVGTVVAPLALAGQPRDVLRTQVEPPLDIQSLLSPLAEYRSNFSDDEFDTVQFTVATDADRVRLATLSYYDGMLARVTDPAASDADQSSAFVRVPASLPAGPGTTATTADVTLVDYSAPWLPLVGGLTGIQFRGTSSAALSEGFYYSAPVQTGVELSGAAALSGASYRQQAAVPSTLPAVSDLQPGNSGPQFAEGTVPESLIEWMRLQEAPNGGAGLVTLIERLRARGYLSHSLTSSAESPPLWQSELGDYSFEPSRAGHSTDRIDGLFTALLQRQNEVGGTDDAPLVAAVGDDEQFAVAAAMVADQLGFSTRIVVGARLVSDDLPACDQGQCTGGDIAAWLEVQDASGVWVPVDVTPQHENPLAPDDVQSRDPENPTRVDPPTAEQVLPGDADPADNSTRTDDPAEETTDWSALWATLRIAGISLLAVILVTGPFLLVLLLKVLRRRGRRRAEAPDDRVTGGWEEYLDAAVDSGLAAPRSHTRTELADLHRESHADSAAGTLATMADRSVFDATPTSEEDSTTFWEIVDTERQRLLADRGWWARVRARLSLRSLRPERWRR